jgi:hypothetical protein
MLPGQLTPEHFAGYPETARRLAADQIELLRRLPLGLLPLLLRELIAYDWKFPAEHREIDGQLAYLKSLAPEALTRAMAPFAGLRLAAALDKLDWINAPAVFTEQLTAHLWNTRQIDAFRAGATSYMRNAKAALPEEPPRGHRLGIAAIGHGVGKNDYRLFRKLRPHGTYFTRVSGSLKSLLEVVAKRAAASPLAYGHWEIDGGPSALPPAEGVTPVSYAAMAGPRAALQLRMQKFYEAPMFDPEAFRTTMAQMQAADIGLGPDGVLTRFQLSLLAEGSGTQVFATTFVQWAAREAWRRAQPMTLLARFGPRQRENPMNVLLAEAQRRPELDPQGSLIDADMGAYYTWVNQQRLPGAEKATFLAWFEDHGEAVAIGPRMQAASVSNEAVQLAELAARLA